MHRLRPLAAFLLAALGSAPAYAQFQGIVSLPPLGAAESRLLLGGTVILRPAYPGADHHRAMVLPYIDYQHRNGFFIGTGSGIGYSFIHTPATQLGVRLIPRFGRDQDDSPALAGMGDIDPGVEASAYWTQRLAPGWTVGLNLRGGNLGAEFDAGVRRDFQLGPATRMSATAFLTAADGRSQRSAFGVDAGQSVASGYPVYSPSSGLRNAQFALTFNHFFARRWVAVGGVGVGRILGDAADSPIVREPTTLTGFAAIGYQFF
jgi:outer membrane protein